jgi:hypothetical protein
MYLNRAPNMATAYGHCIARYAAAAAALEAASDVDAESLQLASFNSGWPGINHMLSSARQGFDQAQFQLAIWYDEMEEHTEAATW